MFPILGLKVVEEADVSTVDTGGTTLRAATQLVSERQSGLSLTCYISNASLCNSLRRSVV